MRGDIMNDDSHYDNSVQEPTGERNRHALLRPRYAPASPGGRATLLAKLAFETDPADVHLDLELVTRASSWWLAQPEAYARCHIPGALNLADPHHQPGDDGVLPRDKVIVTYCWDRDATAPQGRAKLAALGFA